MQEKDLPSYKAKVIWAQVDANHHMRHSAYADFAAQARIEMLESIGLNADIFRKLMIGPILLREELIYLREVNLNDTLHVTCELSKGKTDGSRWSIKHILSKKDGTKAAIINVDGAWIDMKSRKMTKLEGTILESFNKMPKSEDFIIE